jgi:hypothetical protein
MFSFSARAQRLPDTGAPIDTGHATPRQPASVLVTDDAG